MTKDEIRGVAQDLGFALCGFAQAGPAPHAEALGAWLDDGRQASMEWMRRTEEDRGDPRRVGQQPPFVGDLQDAKQERAGEKGDPNFLQDTREEAEAGGAFP